MSLRIAMISDHASPLAAAGGVDSGGQNIYVAQVARHLARQGHAVDVFTRRDDPALPEVLQWADGVRVVHVPAGPAHAVRKEELLPYMAEFGDYLTRFCARQHYDLVHAHFFMSGLVALRLKEVLGLPVVITFHALGRVRRLHQGEADAFPAGREAIEEDLVRRADRVIAECPQDRLDLTQLYHADPARVRVIPCGYDPEELWPVERGVARRLLGLGGDAFVALQLGRLVPRKGVDNAIRGVAVLRDRHDLDAQLWVVGGETHRPDERATPEIGHLRQLARREGVADRVLFLGRRGRSVLRYYYSAADVFVTTPWYEPFGITPLEAMACGTPVVGSRVGGIQFSVPDGKAGFLVPADDPAALADRLACLQRDPGLRARMSRAALDRVRRHFTWEGVAEHVAALYADTVRAAPIVAPARPSVRPASAQPTLSLSLP